MIVRYFIEEPNKRPRIFGEIPADGDGRPDAEAPLIRAAGAVEMDLARRSLDPGRVFDRRGRRGVRPASGEGRSWPSDRRGEPELTVGDRLVTAMMGFVCAFLTMCLVWFIALRYSGGSMEPPLPFSWCWIVGLVVGAAGFLMGPERMMDGFGKVWGAFGAVFRMVFFRQD
jgi:hypothetical protein